MTLKKILIFFLIFLVLAIQVSAENRAINGWVRSEGNITNNYYNGTIINNTINNSFYYNTTINQTINNTYNTTINNSFYYNTTINQTINNTIENPYFLNVSNGSLTYRLGNGTTLFLLAGYGMSISQDNNNITFNFTLSHNDLNGLQGGSANQYYHLNQTIFTYLMTNIYNWITSPLDWWVFENPNFLSPNQTDLTIVTPNGTVPYGNAWHDIGAFGSLYNPLDTHFVNRIFVDDLIVPRGDTANAQYQTPNNLLISPNMDGVVGENVQATHRNDLQHLITTYYDGYKATEFFQGNERMGFAVGQIKDPMYLSYTYPFLATRGYPIVFKRSYLPNYTPSFICTCGFDEENIQWFYAGGEIDCSFYSLTNLGTTGVCNIKDGTLFGERFSYEGNVVMNWQVISEEDYGFNQQGSEINYIEGGLP